jgi:hypothetical protein
MPSMRLAAVLVAGLLAFTPQQAPDPFISIGVWYGGPGVVPPDVPRRPWEQADAWMRDLTAIRAAGFNSVTTWTSWGHAEPIQGRYRFDALEQMLRLAGDVGLRAIVEVFPEPVPEWHAGAPCAPGSTLPAMLVAAGARARPHAGFGEMVMPIRPGEDECRPPRALTPKPAGRAPMEPFQLAATLDVMRSGADPRGGWRVSRLQAAQDVAGGERGPDVTDADVRLWAWAALARGARGIAFDSWPRMVDESGAPTRTAQAASAFAANMARNAGLFASVSPRPARAAVLHIRGPVSPALHRAAFVRNIHVDPVQPGELLSGAASRYAVLLVDGDQPPVVQQALKVFELAGGKVLTNPADLDAVTPDIRIDGAPGLVEARFLESPDAWLLVAINHADMPQKVTMAFGAEIPEAIWVDMDTGNSVSFVQSKDGPTLTHTFPARDVLVLVRSKRLR